MRKREFSAFAVHGLRDAPGNGAVGGEAYDQRAFAAQKPIFDYPCCRFDSTYMTRCCPALFDDACEAVPGLELRNRHLKLARNAVDGVAAAHSVEHAAPDPTPSSR